MEASCINMVEPGDVVLVCVNGLWGARFAEIADRARACTSFFCRLLCRESAAREKLRFFVFAVE